MTLYEMNQQLYEKVPPITDKNKYQEIIYNFLKNNNSKYYLLFNPDERYVTMFTYKDIFRVNDMAKEMTKLIFELGLVKEICPDNNNTALECWIEFNGKTQLFLLFDYTKGVVEV